MLTDVRFTLRQWFRHPVHIVVAAATLGLALGACTTVFSALDALVLRPLPYSEPKRLVQLFETLPDGELNGCPEVSISTGRRGWMDSTPSR